MRTKRESMQVIRFVEFEFNDERRYRLAVRACSGKLNTCWCRLISETVVAEAKSRLHGLCCKLFPYNNHINYVDVLISRVHLL
jgi:hypothetical protein